MKNVENKAQAIYCSEELLKSASLDVFSIISSGKIVTIYDFGFHKNI